MLRILSHPSIDIDGKLDLDNDPTLFGRSLDFKTSHMEADREVLSISLRARESLAVYQTDLETVVPPIEHYADLEIVAGYIQGGVTRVLATSSLELRLAHNRDMVALAFQCERSADDNPLRFVSTELAGDRELVAIAVQSVEFPDSLFWASWELQNDPEIVALAVKTNPCAIEYAGPEITEDREFLKLVCENRGLDAAAKAFGFPMLLQEREILKLCAEKADDSLAKLPNFLRGDEEIVRCAVRGCPHQLRNATLRLRSNLSIALEAVSQCGESLKWLSPDLCADRTVVLAAVKNDARALRWASVDLRRTDREIALLAVRQLGESLQYLEEELCGDREIVTAAVTQDGEALRFANDELRLDRDIVKIALKSHADALMWVKGADLRRDRELVLFAIKQFPLALRHADSSLRGDREIVLEAIRLDGGALRLALPKLRLDTELLLTSISGSDTHSSADRALLGVDGIENLTGADGRTAERTEILRVVEAALTLSGENLRFLPFSMRSDKNLVKIAVAQDGRAIRFAAPEFRGANLDPDSDCDSDAEDDPVPPAAQASTTPKFTSYDRDDLVYSNWALNAHRDVVSAALRSQWE